MLKNPSLKIMMTARLVKEEAMKSKIKFIGLNYKELARYVRIGYDHFEIRAMKLDRIVPRRRYNRGTEPGITGKEPLGREADDEEKWVFPEREPTEMEKRNLLAASLEIAVRAAFKSHTYKFAGAIYQQVEGGPIGMRLTGACAKIVMGVWSRKFKQILREADVALWLASGYVDDVRFLTSAIEKGVKWDKKEKKFVYKKDTL